MINLKILFSGLVSVPLLLLGSCSSDSNNAPEAGTPDSSLSSKGKVYMTVAVKYPSMRSSTDASGNTNSDANPDFEVGSDEENSVTSVLIVLTDDSNNYVSHSIVDNASLASGVATMQYKAAFDLKDLTNAYKAGLLKEGGSANIWVYCNPTAQLLENVAGGFAEGWLDWNGTWNGSALDPNLIWNDNAFLMTNSTLYNKRDLPAPSDWEGYTNVTNSYDLTAGIPVPVERVAARIDFKDGSAGNATYPIKSIDGEKEILKVRLADMALLNLSKSYYFLRRVSKDGLAAEAYYGGTETPLNYVVDVDAAAKASGSITVSNASDYFNAPLYDATGKYAPINWEKVSDVLGTPDDNWLETPTYSKWHYMTENTIPDPSNQITLLTTGIVFRGVLSAGNDASASLSAALTDVTAQSPVLLVYDEVIYTGFDEVVEAAKASSSGSIREAATMVLNAIGSSLDNYTGLTELTPAIKTALSNNGFSIYAPSQDNDGTWGYYCYYFFWNRHNDNGLSEIMGPMEYAVVRNNVYKLSVDMIGRLGHPVDPDDDPDPVRPNDPDEKSDLYMSVTFNVIPWVVRVNSVTYP